MDLSCVKVDKDQSKVVDFICDNRKEINEFVGGGDILKNLQERGKTRENGIFTMFGYIDNKKNLYIVIITNTGKMLIRLRDYVNNYKTFELWLQTYPLKSNVTKTIKDVTAVACAVKAKLLEREIHLQITPILGEKPYCQK